VRLPAFEIGDEPDAACVALERWIKKTLGGGTVCAADFIFQRW
jgi:hypothetical protein